MPDYQHLPIYLKIYQFVKFLYGTVKNLPKEHKYALGKDMLELGWKCLDLILEANSLPNDKKYAKIGELSVTFDKLKIRIRMAQELSLISGKQFAHIYAYYGKESGEMIGGWLNWSAKL